MPYRPIALIILDGFGLGPETSSNAVHLADTPTFDRLWREWPHTRLIASGREVGLPAGQMGNSEVGHTNIGAGRVVAMDLGAIDLAVEDGSFALNDAVLAFAAAVHRRLGHPACCYRQRIGLPWGPEPVRAGRHFGYPPGHDLGNRKRSCQSWS